MCACPCHGLGMASATPLWMGQPLWNHLSSLALVGVKLEILVHVCGFVVDAKRKFSLMVGGGNVMSMAYFSDPCLS